jgi:hypothetical protein
MANCETKFQLVSYALTPRSLGQPIISQYNPSSVPRKRQTSGDATIHALQHAHIRTLNPKELILTPLLATPQHDPPPRCPASNPFGTEAHRKDDAPALHYDGCQFPESPVAGSVFGVCCSSHDLCIQSCEYELEDCSNDFQFCVSSQCDSFFADQSNKELKTWGCHQLGDYYTNVLRDHDGATEFVSTNLQTCTCDCPASKNFTCGNACVNTDQDPLNCGSCGKIVSRSQAT